MFVRLVCGAKRREPGMMLTRLGRRVEIDAVSMYMCTYLIIRCCCLCLQSTINPLIITQLQRHSVDVIAPCIRIVSPDPPYGVDPSVLNEVAIPVDSHWELHRTQ